MKKIIRYLYNPLQDSGNTAEERAQRIEESEKGLGWYVAILSKWNVPWWGMLVRFSKLMKRKNFSSQDSEVVYAIFY